MKTAGKIILSVIIVSVIYTYIRNTKIEKSISKINTNTVSTQTDFVPECTEAYSQEKVYSISEETYSDSEKEDEYIQKEESQIEEVENLSQDNGLKSMSVMDLKDLAREQQIKGFSRMKKIELIEILS